jgi:hypothetical protein
MKGKSKPGNQLRFYLAEEKSWTRESGDKDTITQKIPNLEKQKTIVIVGLC